MQRKLAFLLVGLGLFSWLWVGSYVGLREFNRDTSLWSKLVIDDIMPPLLIEIPAWMEPVKFVYRPLIAIDERVTGERVQFGEWRRLHIGATANF